MFCHIVPTTYLKSWKVKTNSNSIYVFDKNNLQLKGDLKNILNLKGTSFGKTNFFYLKITTCDLNIYDKLFIPIINELNKSYILEYKNNPIKEPGLFRIIYLNHKQEIVVKRKNDNKMIKISRLESTINQLWNNEQKLFIESFFSSQIENDWNSFLNVVQSKEKFTTIDSQEKKYLSLFISVQLYRDGMIIDKQLNQIIPKFITINYKNNNIQNKILIDVLFEFIFDYKNNVTSSKNVIYNTYINLLNNKWDYNFLFNKNCNFLTSDTPIFIDNFNGVESIFFPISPNVCLIMSKSNKDSIVTKYTNEQIFINSLIIKHSKENIAYYEEIIDKSIYS